MAEIESSFIADIDSLQAGSISVDEFVLRARIFYEKIKGSPIKLPQVEEKKILSVLPSVGGTTSDVKKPSPAIITGDNLPNDVRITINGMKVSLPYQLLAGKYTIRLERDGFQPIKISQTLNSAQTFTLNPKWIPITKVSRIPHIGLYVSYLKWGESEGSYDPPLEFGVKSHISKVMTSYLDAEITAGYYRIFDKWWDDVLYKNIELGINSFPIRATLISHPFNRKASPFIGFGPTIIYKRETSDFFHDDGSYAYSEHSQYMNYGGHILLGIDISITSYMTFSGSFRYEINDILPVQISASLMFKIR